MHTPLDAVIFDYGEVLCTRPSPAELLHIKRLSELDADTFRHLYWRFRDDYDRGALDGPAYWRAIAQAAGRRYDEARIAALILADTSMWSHLCEPMVAWTETLVEHGLRVAILSNMMPDLLRSMRRDFAWLGQLTHCTWSCELGWVKPEPEIYRECLAGLGVEAGRALFIDNLARNVEGARAVGLHGVVFESPEQLHRDLQAAGYALPLPGRDLVRV